MRAAIDADFQALNAGHFGVIAIARDTSGVSTEGAQTTDPDLFRPMVRGVRASLAENSRVFIVYIHHSRLLRIVRGNNRLPRTKFASFDLT